MYQSTIFGTSVRPRAPPNAVPFQTRPVTSWNGRVEISFPASATPMMTDPPHPAWQSLQRLAHHGSIPGTVEGIIGAALGKRNQMLDDITIDLRRIDEMRHAKAAAPFLLGIIEVNPNDFVGADHSRALNDVEPDAAEPEHDNVCARCHLGGVDHRADTRRHAATDVATLVECRVFANPGDGYFRQHGKVRESRAAHIVEDWFAVVAEARCAIRHHSLALRRADGGTEIGFAAQTAFALAAFRRVKRDYVIAGLYRGDACSDLTNNPRALMTEDRRKDSFAVEAVEGVGA